MKQIVILLILFIASSSMFAQNDILGKWKTIDENTGKARSIVEIYKTGDLYAGRIIELFRVPGEDPDPVCDKCDGTDKGKKVIGLEIIKDMALDDDVMDDGQILDPENGKTYDCKLWVEDGKLMVRGYIAFFFRTQEWERLEG